MPAPETTERVRDALDVLKENSVKDRSLVEVLSLSQDLAEVMQVFFGSLDRSVTGEFRHIADFIHKARDEIAALRPNDIRQSRIPSAGAELDAIVRDTEKATETIMSEAEAVLGSEATDFDAYRAELEGRMMAIIEACSFQDLTGQRVSKVVTTLKNIEERVSSFATALGVDDAAPPEESEDERRKRELLLNGPALDGPETDQAAVDALLADETAGLGQDDIDALFD